MAKILRLAWSGTERDVSGTHRKMAALLSEGQDQEGGRRMPYEREDLNIRRQQRGLVKSVLRTAMCHYHSL
jgi:hypothetical protein